MGQFGTLKIYSNFVKLKGQFGTLLTSLRAKKEQFNWAKQVEVDQSVF